ncbi:MAG: M48 family metallopeptidase [Desulfovibrio sp.]|nr:M48 family metallopeptidase [Desulfovibrio sp.]
MTQSVPMDSNAIFWLWGERFSLRGIEDDKKANVALADVDEQGKTLTVYVHTGRMEHLLLYVRRWGKQCVLNTGSKYLKFWENKLGLTPVSLVAKAMKTRWGSCAIHKRQVTLNTDLVHRNARYLEYVLVHELTHLFESGHGPQFYALLEAHIPDWRRLRDDLKLPFPPPDIGI